MLLSASSVRVSHNLSYTCRLLEQRLRPTGSLLGYSCQTAIQKQCKRSIVSDGEYLKSSWTSSAQPSVADTEESRHNQSEFCLKIDCGCNKHCVMKPMGLEAVVRIMSHGIQSSMEAILACHPALSTAWLDWVAKWCER